MWQDVKNFVEEIKSAGGPAELFLYEGEQHAFMNSAEDSIERMQSAPAVSRACMHACIACPPPCTGDSIHFNCTHACSCWTSELPLLTGAIIHINALHAFRSTTAV